MSGRDRGSATAELAVGLPALTLFLVVGLSAVSAVTTQLRCLSAARDGALAAARGEAGATAARRAAPPGATVTLTFDGDTVRARVQAPVAPLGQLLSGLTVTAESVATVEPGVPEPVR